MIKSSQLMDHRSAKFSSVRDQSTDKLPAINWYALKVNFKENCNQREVNAKIVNGKYKMKGFIL